MFSGKHVRRKRKVFTTWLASYAIILIIPIIISSLAYSQSIKTIGEEVNKTNDASLKQFKILVDGKLKELENIANSIVFDTDVKAVMSSQILYTPDVHYKSREIQAELSQYILSNEIIDKIYLYYAGANFLLSNNSFYREESIIYDVVYRNLRLSADEWQDFTQNDTYREYVIKSTQDANGQIQTNTFLSQAVYGGDMKAPAGRLIILINEDKLNDLIYNMKWSSNGLSAVIDGGNNFIGNKSIGALPAFLEYDNLTGAQDLFYEELNDEKVVVSHAHSDVNDWEYISAIPTNIYLEKVQRIKTILYIYVAICLLIGFLIAYIIAKRNYDPLKRLISIFENNQSGAPDAGQNEFSYLENSLRDLLDEQANYRKKIDQQYETLRNNFINRLLKGRIRNINLLKSACETYDIVFKSSSFIVMTFSIEDHKALFFNEKMEDDDDTVNLIYFIINAVKEEFNDKNHYVYPVEIDRMMSCIVSLGSADARDREYSLVKEELTQAADKIRTVLNDRFGIILSIGISEVCVGEMNIHAAYAQTLEIIEYKAIIGDFNSITHFSEIASVEEGGLGDSGFLEKEKQFTNCILAEDYKGARDILEDLIANDILENTKSIQMIKCRTFGLINSLINAIGEISITMDERFFEELDPVNRLLTSNSIAELQIQVKIIFEKLNEYYSGREEETSLGRLKEIEDYVKDNYVDTELSITVLSDKFQMSPSYLSRKFKNYTGTGLLHYIHKMRIDNAKILMKDKRLSIKDIAEKVGYYNNVAMNRAFKKYEGITPGKFREYLLPDD